MNLKFEIYIIITSIKMHSRDKIKLNIHNEKFF